ncbi:MAG TPA: hypothetical protein VED01_21650 [Burkholderiales bacterium]|nr:hypothetical protein [Burkholderiales bacterium]
MAKKEREDTKALTRVVTNYAAVIVAIGLMVVSMLLLVFTHGATTWYGALGREVGAIIFAAAVIHLTWDLVLKRALMKELWAYAKLSSDVARAGVVSVDLVQSFQTEVDWDSLFEGAKTFTSFFAYASTWRHSCEHHLRALADDSEARVTMFLPDPADQCVLSKLAAAYDSTPQEVASKIRAAAEELRHIFRGKKGDPLNLIYVPAIPHHTFYRFDSGAIITFTKHGKGRGDVLAIGVKRQGWLWNYLDGEIQALRQEGTPASEEQSE